MPRIQVLTEVAGRDAKVMLTEHVPAEMFSDGHYAHQLVERMGWALFDAEDHERTANRPALPLEEAPPRP